MVLWQILFSFFVFFLPTQLGWHFWPSYTYVFGLKVDYLSPTLYLTDILLVLTLVGWRIQSFKDSRLSAGRQGRRRFRVAKTALGVFVFLFINIVFAQNHWLAFWKALKILEVMGLAYLVFKEGSFVGKKLGRLLPWVVTYESLIGICQFIRQSSLDGLFWFLGERTFSLMTPGIAKGELWGRLSLRPYATFSHPNSLAGFVLICLILVVVKRKLTRIDVTALLLGAAILVLSFSRVVWATILILVPYYFSKKLKSNRKIILTVCLAFITFFLILLIKNSSFEESYFQRVELNSVAIKLFSRSPIIGVGLNNFIPVMATQKNFGQIYWLQPVHNIFLLMVAETGLVGLFLFLILMVKLFKYLLEVRNLKLEMATIAILLTGLFDHYWLTLQQNLLLLGIIIGIGFPKKSVRIFPKIFFKFFAKIKYIYFLIFIK